MRSGGYVRIPSVILRTKFLTGTEKCIFSAMLAYQGSGSCCIASYERIARRCGTDRSTVIRAIKQLAAQHLIRHATPAEISAHDKRRGGINECPTNAWVVTPHPVDGPRVKSGGKLPLDPNPK